MAQPTAQEQLMLELVNRARANPSAEAARFGIGLNDGIAAGNSISTSAKQPLVFNEQLIDSARGHSAWMLSTNTFSHTGAGGSNSQARMIQAGYGFSGGGSSGENLAWEGTSGPVDVTALITSEHESLVRSPGHRANILRDNYKEIGIGALTGLFQNFNSLLTTQNYANSGNGAVFLTGVAYNDAVLNDDFYTVGEGLGGVRVDAISATGQRLSTSTYGSGGYGLAAAPGSYSVFFSGGSLGTNIVRKQATVGNQNVKLDLEFGPNAAPQTTLDPLQYSASHPDLMRAFGVNTEALFEHYLSAGIREGRSFDSFDEARYLASNVDLMGAFGSDLQAATRHYIQYGAGEGRSLTAFDGAQYLASYSDLRSAFGSNTALATQHYIQNGRREGRSTDLFDEARYLASNGDLITAFKYNLEAATQHYLSYGASERRSTTAFNANSYLNRYNDLRTAFGNNTQAATRHFIEHGYAEGRLS